MMELRGDLLMHALVSNDVTFEIGIYLAYTVRPEIRQCQSQDRLAGMYNVNRDTTLRLGSMAEDGRQLSHAEGDSASPVFDSIRSA